MWSYYGSKSKIVDYYPKPKYHRIIEPFAGSARYALKYFDNEVLLIDKNPAIILIWEYLQECSEQDILKLPILPAGTRIKREDFDCDGQYMLMRYLIVQAPFGANNIVSNFGAKALKANIKNVAKNVFKIRHWELRCDSYENVLNEKATWFVDPPYQNGGHKYLMGNKKIDFNYLARWCKALKGQVIVCENTKSNWLPFVPMVSQKGIRYRTKEAIWTNQKTEYDNVQGELFTG